MMIIKTMSIIMNAQCILEDCTTLKKKKKKDLLCLNVYLYCNENNE